MNQQIKNHFLELKLTGQRVTVPLEEKRAKDLKLIEYLKSMIANKEVTEFEDIGFCYWNISDNYALFWDGHALRKNHQSFYKYVTENDPGYLYWLVCDATQRLTLEKDGYSDWWWSVYREAVSRNQDNMNLFAEFCAHRAALYRNPMLPAEQNYITFAMESYKVFLEKTKETLEYSFYKMIYLTSVSKYSSTDNGEIEALSQELLPDLLYADESRDFLVGEWKSFITPFGKRKRAVVGLTSAVNALLDSGESDRAKTLYFLACDKGLSKNAYIEKRFSAPNRKTD